MTRPISTWMKCWWKLDEVSGTRYNSHPGGVNLADVNTVGQGEGRYYDWGNKGADFIAANDEYLWVADSPATRPGDFDMSFGLWIRAHDVDSDSVLYGRWDASYGEYRINIDSYRATLVVYGNSGQYTVTATNFGNLSNDEWYFIGGYYDATTDKIGIGVNDVWNEAAGPPGGIDNYSRSFYLGTYGFIGVLHFDGEMDDAFLYSGGSRFTTIEWTWMYNNGIGRRYEDAMNTYNPPSLFLRTQPTIPEIYIYDSSLDYIGLVEDYSSLNWAERYNEEGDFELEVPLSYAGNALFDLGNYLYIPTSNKMMIVEERKPSRTPTDGKMVVNGRSAESILRRRTLMALNTFNEVSAEFYIYTRVYWGVVAPADADREMPIFEDGSGDFWPPSMDSVTEVSVQYETERLYEVIEGLAKAASLGFNIVVGDLTDASSKLYFYVYEGVDRSASVEFSDAYRNLLDSSFLITEKGTINTVQIRTSDAVYDQLFVWIGGNSVAGGGTEPSGSGRYEGLLETSVERDTDGDDVDDMSDAECLAILQERGEQLIKESVPLTVFDGDVDSRGTYTLGVDYFLGDIVQVNAHGEDAKARIIEVVKSYSVEGEKFYITFDFEDV